MKALITPCSNLTPQEQEEKIVELRHEINSIMSVSQAQVNTAQKLVLDLQRQLTELEARK